MDLRLIVRVVRRFKYIVAAGILATAAGAFLSYAKVGPHGVEYRTPQTYLSVARVLVTTDQKYAIGEGPDPRGVVTLYASLASSDEVRIAAFRRHRIPGGISASAAYDKDSQALLPIVNVTAVSLTPKDSATLATDGVAALNTYILHQEDAAGQPPAQRFHLEYLNAPSPLTAMVASPRSKTRPIMVFVLGIAATLALVLILENLRPRLREARLESERAA